MKVFLLVIVLALPLVARAKAVTCDLNITDAITQVFGVPATADMAQAFALGFITPMTVYLASYMVGVLVNFWNS